MDDTTTRRAKVRELRSRHTMAGLLVLILVSLAVQLAVPDTDVARLVIVLLQGATLMVALWVSGSRKSLVRLAALAVVASTATAVAALAGIGDLSSSPTGIVTLFLIALAPAAIIAGIVRDVREQDEVTMRTMFGVLCVYLLVGMFFSFCFNVVQELSHEPFFTGGLNGDISDFLYFSFTTLTTTGFGDFTAGTDVGRSFVVTEALIGQIYLVTVVAVIVANMRPRRRTA